MMISTSYAKEWQHHVMPTPNQANTVRIIKKTGSATSLICASGKELKFCWFRQPNSSHNIMIDPAMIKLFQESLQPITIVANRNQCGIRIHKISRQHEGTWACQVYRSANLTTTNRKWAMQWKGMPMEKMNKFFIIEITEEGERNKQVTGPYYYTVSIVPIALIMAILAAITLLNKQTRMERAGYQVRCGTMI